MGNKTTDIENIKLMCNTLKDKTLELSKLLKVQPGDKGFISMLDFVASWSETEFHVSLWEWTPIYFCKAKQLLKQNFSFEESLTKAVELIVSSAANLLPTEAQLEDLRARDLFCVVATVCPAYLDIDDPSQGYWNSYMMKYQEISKETFLSHSLTNITESGLMVAQENKLESIQNGLEAFPFVKFIDEETDKREKQTVQIIFALSAKDKKNLVNWYNTSLSCGRLLYLDYMI